MQPDTVQIGSLVISKTVFDALIVLTSVVIGGLISYFTTRGIENKRWADQKRDKLQEHRREALALALEWIHPIENALSQASLLSSGFIKNKVSVDELIKSWPNLHSQLATINIPMRLNVLLPQLVQKRIDEIIDKLHEIQSYTLFSNREGKSKKEEWVKSFNLFTQQISSLNDFSDSLKRELKSEYEKTFT